MLKILVSFVILAVVLRDCSASSVRSSKNELPKLDQDEWWGPEYLKEEQDTSIRPFKITFNEEMIQDLRNRLKSHRPLTPPLNGTGFEYGFNTNVMDGWVKYWAEEYPFKEREAFLNQFPHYKTNIQGLDIHFIRVKPEVPDSVEVVPLLLMHGWPGSIREFYEIMPLLTKPLPGYNFVFEVIAPSLPGYGYSDGAVRPGLATPRMAVILKNLMNRLGFEKFYVQGGDWGAIIASGMATLYPDVVLGHHSNFAVVQSLQGLYKMILGDFIPSLVAGNHLIDRMDSVYSYFEFMMEEYGYLHLQSTKPDTVGVALSDSPTGLLAYILEKFGAWTRLELRYQHDGGITFRFDKEQLIDNLMMYWAPNCITTSVRLYAEELAQQNRELDLHSYSTPVPTWALQAKYEMFYQPPSILGIKYTNLLGTTLLDDGGHFLAFEFPQEVADDIFKAVNAFKNWHNKTAHTEL